MNKRLAILLFILVAILCVYTIGSDLSDNKLEMQQLILAVSLCVISGIANAYNSVYSKILSQHKFSAAQVLAVRFYFTLIAACTVLLISNQPIVPSSEEFFPIVLVAFASTIIPIYILQLGISFSNAIAVALITPILPALTFFLELLDPRIAFSAPLLVIILLISMVILSAAIYKIRQTKLDLKGG